VSDTVLEGLRVMVACGRRTHFASRSTLARLL